MTMTNEQRETQRKKEIISRRGRRESEYEALFRKTIANINIMSIAPRLISAGKGNTKPLWSNQLRSTSQHEDREIHVPHRAQQYGWKWNPDSEAGMDGGQSLEMQRSPVANEAEDAKCTDLYHVSAPLYRCFSCERQPHPAHPLICRSRAVAFCISPYF